jgi:tetratricopeptide (TPR) repeat protein
MIDPNWWMAHRGLFHLYIELGRFDEALKVAEKRKYAHLSMAYLYARMGNRQKALELLNQSTDNDPFELAQLYAALNDFDNAFQVINQSLDRREGFMFGYCNYLALDRLESDPRWKAVARRMNFPQTLIDVRAKYASDLMKQPRFMRVGGRLISRRRIAIESSSGFNKGECEFCEIRERQWKRV